MQLRLFIVPVKNLSIPEGEMNSFLRSHRVLAVKKESVLVAIFRRAYTLGMKSMGGFSLRRKMLLATGLFGFFALAVTTHAAAPVVSNVRASQRSGTGMVDIYYDLASASNTLTVSVAVSTNSGAAFNVPAFSMSGDLDSSITPGTSKHVVWNSGEDLAALYFPNVQVRVTADDSSAPYGNPVSFRVDMSSQPTANQVYARGSFNGWDLNNQLFNNGYDVYTNTVKIPGSAGTNIEYKFYYEPGARWEEPGSNCSVNRSFTLAGGPQTLPLIYWNDIPLGSPTNFITFQVDMTQEILSGAFTNGMSEVRVSGTFNYWSNGNLMTNNPALAGAASNIYTATVNIPSPQGMCHVYKFRENGGWENPASTAGNPYNNRSFIITGGNQVLPLVFYNQ